MTIERVFDGTYDAFKGSRNAVLVIGRNSCVDCKAYDIIIQDIHDDALARGLPIRFGKAVLDEQSPTEGIRTEHKGTGMTCIPYTVLYQEGKQVAAISNIRDNTYVKEQIEKHLGVKI